MANQAPDDDDALLTIKQAARLLNVSEVSLRRWTDSGRLACLRIGARRERRFRRSDLLDFPEQQGARAPLAGGGKEGSREPQEASTSTAVKVHIGGVAIDYGSHLCSFYETDLGRAKLAVPFLADGLKAGDICFFIATSKVRRQVLKELEKQCPDLKRAKDSGQLKLLAGKRSGQEMLDYFEAEFVAATRTGNARLRVLGDMAWFLEKELGIEELNAFERAYNHSLGHRFPVVSLCQYDARVFSGVGILGALKAHEDTFRYPLSRFMGLDKHKVA